MEKEGRRHVYVQLPFQHVPGQGAYLCLGARKNFGILGFRGTQQDCMPSKLKLLGFVGYQSKLVH